MIKFNEVTWYSKLATAIFFLGVLPALAFYVGVRYQEVRGAENEAPRVPAMVAPPSAHAGGKIKYVTKEINGYQVPQVVDFPDSVVMAKVNARLAAMANGFGCEEGLPDEAGAPRNYYEAKVAVSYAENDILSVSVHTGWYCGGPYPTNSMPESVTFDMRTGEEVAFADLFENYARDRDAIAAVIFARQIGEYIGPSSNGTCNGLYVLGCEGDCLSFNEYLSYKIEGDGVTAQPIFPHVIEACSEEGHASAASLARFFGPSSLLSRM